MYPLSTYTARLLQSASFFTLLRQGEFAQLCPYHGVFNQLKYLHCTTGCCGNYHHAYCCIDRHFREISAGSIGGFILLVGLICLTVCCYRRMQQRREEDGSLRNVLRGFRNYGSVNTNKTTDQQEADTANTANTAIQPESSVHLTITPPTPTPLAQEEHFKTSASNSFRPVKMGNQPSSPRVEVVTYEEPVAPPPEIEVDITVDEYGNVIETETVVLPGPEPYPPYEGPVVIETVSEPDVPAPYIEGNPYYRPYGGVTEVVYNPYPAEPEPVVVEEYYGGGGEPEVEITTYPGGGGGYPAGYVEYNDDPFPDTDPYYPDDTEPYQ